MAWPISNSLLYTLAHRALLQVHVAAVVNIIFFAHFPTARYCQHRHRPRFFFCSRFSPHFRSRHHRICGLIIALLARVPTFQIPSLPVTQASLGPTSHLVQVSSALVEADRPVSPILSILSGHPTAPAACARTCSSKPPSPSKLPLPT
ncbi:uncharacterized protein BDZ83DRAFT_8456 [Colletotrichum acutatum]|uniref:Uncharacterized protein n=1 Tax=Glomerella acutata TaxID=27357 RepID=A0AAD8XQW2_GLOAC|nr:uncharacterized protein BDZ83DRAFT_8456 [Colletotrichum acutatum]KAK1731884.1 hypothetical protein BDZ83DRAFT_8456 [Colletotrichum acutatum]